jgi:hypothetical protein
MKLYKAERPTFIIGWSVDLNGVAADFDSSKISMATSLIAAAGKL